MTPLCWHTATEAYKVKLNKLVRNAAKIGLYVNKDKTKTMRNNCQAADPCSQTRRTIHRIRNSLCGSEEHLEDENDQQENKDTNFQEQCILSVLLYAAESWKVTKGICHMLEVFQNKCLRRILHIFWPNKITNAELHERTGVLPR